MLSSILDEIASYDHFLSQATSKLVFAEAYEELKSDWELALEALGLPPTAECIEVICTIHRIKEKAEGIQPDLGTD